MKRSITSLLDTDILQFHSLLCVFESSVKHIKTDKEFERLFPKTVKEFKTQFPIRGRSCIRGSKSNQIASVIPNPGEMYLTVKHTKMLSFFRHLRNAYAHNNITLTNDYYVVKDYYNRTPTAIGKISRKAVMDILKLIEKEASNINNNKQ